MIKANPCLSCGACCAFFRASFYWGETDAVAGGTVPQALTQQLTPFRAVMCGTDQPNPRCIALTGEIGVQVSCKIHPLRSSVCRDFSASWENGEHNPDCDRARAKHGLPPLMPDSSNKPEPLPPSVAA